MTNINFDTRYMEKRTFYEKNTFWNGHYKKLG